MCVCHQQPYHMNIIFCFVQCTEPQMKRNTSICQTIGCWRCDVKWLIAQIMPCNPIKWLELFCKNKVDNNVKISGVFHFKDTIMEKHTKLNNVPCECECLCVTLFLSLSVSVSLYLYAIYLMLFIFFSFIRPLSLSFNSMQIRTTAWIRKFSSYFGNAKSSEGCRNCVKSKRMMKKEERKGEVETPREIECF